MICFSDIIFKVSLPLIGLFDFHEGKIKSILSVLFSCWCEHFQLWSIIILCWLFLTTSLELLLLLLLAGIAFIRTVMWREVRKWLLSVRVPQPRENIRAFVERIRITWWKMWREFYFLNEGVTATFRKRKWCCWSLRWSHSHNHGRWFFDYPISGDLRTDSYWSALGDDNWSSWLRFIRVVLRLLLYRFLLRRHSNRWLAHSLDNVC